MKIEFSQLFFEISSIIKFHENPSLGNRVVPRGQTDIFHGRNNITCSTDCKYRTAATLKLIVVFRNFSNAFNNQDKICAAVTVKFRLWSKNVKSATQEEAVLCAVLYGRERWPLFYRKVHRMGKFELKMMSRIFGPNINGVKDGGQRESMRSCAIFTCN